MGLDQYFYKTKKSISEKDIQELNRKVNYGDISLEKFEETAECIKYFNKNYDLQEAVFEVWQKKKKNDNIDSFNLTGKKSPTSIGGTMNCPIVF